MTSGDTDHPVAADGAEVPSANTWVDCACGQRHWGRYGAAGLLLRWQPAEPGPPEVLLQHRAAWTHQGGTWALPGGARSHDETPAQAALREAGEEAGLDPGGVVTGELVVVDHGPWSYTYVLASIGERPDLVPSDAETEALAWVAVDRVEDYPLHPLFASAWPDLRARLSPVSDS